MHKFSIILPVRNGGEYVKTCIGSLLAQTIDDYNIIVLDNCSTDGSREWLASLQNDRIIIYPSDKPLTIEDNWARVKTVVKNQFITLIGHDDVLYPDFLEKVNGLINTYPHAGLYHTHFNFIDAEGKTIRGSKPMQGFYSFPDLLSAFLQHSVDSMGTGYVMRSEDYDAVGGIPVKYPSLLFADFDLWLSLAAKGGMAVDTGTCFAFRVHKSTTGTSQDNKLHQGLSIYIDRLLHLKNTSKDAAMVIDKCGGELLLFYCKGFSHRLLRTPLQQRQGLTVDQFIADTVSMAATLGITGYKPLSHFSIYIASMIDRFSITRKAFLLFKSIYSKPVL